MGASIPRSRRRSGARTAVLVLIAATALSACGSQPAPTPGPSGAVPPSPTPVPSAAGLPAPTPVASGVAQPGVDLAVWSSHDRSPAKGTLTYRVHYANLGADLPAEKVALQVIPPEGANLLKVSRDSQPLSTGNGVEVPLGTLQPAESGVVDVVVEWPAAPAPGSWTVLTAQISGSATDPDMANNVAHDGERVPAPNLAVTLGPADTSGPFVPGGTAALLLGYSNTSSVDAGSATLSVTLPKGLSFRSASGGDLAGTPTTAAAGEDSLVTLSLRGVRARSSGSVVMQVTLDAGLLPDQQLTASALITTAADTTAADNRAETTGLVQAAGPDAWVALDSKGATELGGTHSYRIRYGNRGTASAEGVSLSLAIPGALHDVRFGVQPAAIANGTATWQLGTLPAARNGNPIEITASIGATGPVVTSAKITSSGPDANALNNAAEVAHDLVALQLPVISGPSDATVGAQPAFFGTGKPSATVSLYLANGDDPAGQLLGSGLVGGDGRWAITPSSSLSEAGWHWFTATQQLGGLVSPITGVADFYSADLAIDSNSLTVDGKRVGGINQTIAWPAGKTLTFGARIVNCASPISPTLQADFYDTSDVLVNRGLIAAARAQPDGYVEFKFVVPRADQEVQWRLSLGFYCQGLLKTNLLNGARLVSFLTAAKEEPSLWNLWCLFGCDDAPPPPPPKCGFAGGCEQVKRKHKSTTDEDNPLSPPRWM